MTPPLTDAEIAEMERLERAATGGKWSVGTWSGQCHKKHDHDGPERDGGSCVYEWMLRDYCQDIVAPPNLTVCLANDWGPGMPNAPDRDLVVALRNAAPRLLASARDANRLRAQVDDLRHLLRWAYDEGIDDDEIALLEAIEKALSSTAPDDAGGRGGVE